MATAMAQSRPAHRTETLRKDFLASIVVFLVALPLCMGIAIASGVPPAAGLITGIVGGLVVGFLAGSPLQVSGPAAGLSVIVYMEVQENGIEMLGVIVLIAGIVQIVAGLFKIGQWFRAVSPAVIQGMLAGIGVLIFASQFHVMVDDAPPGTGLQNLVTIPLAIWKGIRPPFGTVHHWAATVGLITIVSIVLWQSFAPRRIRIIPAPLLAVVIASVFAVVTGLPIKFVDVPSNLLDAVRFPPLAGWTHLLDWHLVFAGMAMALVASAETLLCATAVDKMHNGPRTQYDKELWAQGVGNAICGLVGGLPMTGVIVRSSANVQAGGRTRASAILHGLWLLIFVAALPFVLANIPTAALAGILVFTGYKLINPKAVRSLARYGKGELAIYFVTLIMIVVTDLLTGVLVGVGLSIGKLVYTFSNLQIRLEPSADGRKTVLYLNGAATFVSLPKLARTLETVPAATELHVHFEALDYIDHACLDLLMNWEVQHESTGGSLVIDWDSLHARFRREPPARTQARQQPEMAAEPKDREVEPVSVS